MIRKAFLFLFILALSTGFCRSQAFIRTADLFSRPYDAGQLNIIQSQAIDTLLSRSILSNKKQKTSEGKQGMQGFRIQIYYSSVRSAREESSKARAEFISKFPDLISYAEYQEPGWFMVRAGDYRSKTEGYKDLLLVRKVFPNAYLVPTTINFPDLKEK
jgi:hypothetical protein